MNGRRECCPTNRNFTAPSVAACRSMRCNKSPAPSVRAAGVPRGRAIWLDAQGGRIAKRPAPEIAVDASSTGPQRLEYVWLSYAVDFTSRTRSDVR